MKPIVLIIAAAVVVTGCDKKPETASTPATPSAPVTNAVTSAAPSVEGRAIPVTVGADGFRPSQVTVTKGESATLVFTRTSDDTCAKEVVFPDLKLTKSLPLNQAVAVIVPSGEARTLGFQCGMGMFKSKVVVQ